MPNDRPRRLKRSPRACDFCHRRRVKCEQSSTPGRCRNCDDFDTECVYTRPSRRTHGPETASPGVAQSPMAIAPGEIPRSRAGHQHSMLWTEPLSSSWRAFAQSSIPAVVGLLDVYRETVYPIFPYFDCSILKQRIEKHEHVQCRPLFAFVMAACALASARRRDGALATKSPMGDLADIYLAAAEEALPSNLLDCRDTDYLRAFALLALASLQDADIVAMHMYIGNYFTLISMNQWHDEVHWPANAQVEDLRVLFWSMYTLDVFSAVVWDSCLHFQESQAKVHYPSIGGEGNWIVGWNFTTDMYRILEHNLNKLRSKTSRFDTISLAAVSNVDDHVAVMYSQLPSVFHEIQDPVGNPGNDIYGFQAANIQATMGLLRMVSLTLEVDVDLDKKCTVVSEVLSTFHRVPRPYLRAISAPIVYHIGGIGTILGSVMENPLTSSACHRVRDLLVSMAKLLDSCEAFLRQGPGASQKLRDLAVRVDVYMQERNSSSLPTMLAPPDPTGPSASIEMGHEWAGASIDMSAFQLPSELFEDWTWPFAASNPYSHV